MLRALQWEKGAAAAERLRVLARRALRPAAVAGMMFLLMHAELMLRAPPWAMRAT